MSVVIGPFRAAAASKLATVPPRTLAAISFAFCPPSFRAGTSASTIFRSSPTSFFTWRVERHLGNVLQPRNGPRLLSRRIIGLPHFSHFTGVMILVLGGSGRP